jgi:hypothetical protein
VSLIQRTDHSFSLALRWRDIGLMAIPLVFLNLLDVVLTFYAINVLGFMEINPLAAGFPVWLFVLKFGVCFIPVVCAYMLDVLEMGNYLLLPFVFSAILIEFYAFVVAFNVRNILGV